MFSKRKKIKEDASQLFGAHNLSFNTESLKKTSGWKNTENNNINEESNTKEEKEKEDVWSQWWKVDPSNTHRIKWRLYEKIILSLEGLMIIYFLLWYFGLVPIF